MPARKELTEAAHWYVSGIQPRDLYLRPSLRLPGLYLCPMRKDGGGAQSKIGLQGRNQGTAQSRDRIRVSKTGQAWPGGVTEICPIRILRTASSPITLRVSEALSNQDAGKEKALSIQRRKWTPLNSVVMSLSVPGGVLAHLPGAALGVLSSSRSPSRAAEPQGRHPEILERD